jgi:hypothetical protein
MMVRTMRLPSTLATLAGAVALAACGGDDGSDSAGSEPAAEPPPAAEPAAEESPPTAGDANEGDDNEREPGAGEGTDEGGDEDGGDPEQAVERAVGRYVKAIDARDGARVCALLAPGALDGVRLPRERGSCAASLSASIGYRDPRGVPQFEGAGLATVARTRISADQASATATVLTTFADRDEPSLEDDVIYLQRDGGRWLIAKASPTLYRAIGVPDVPPSALSPP